MDAPRPLPRWRWVHVGVAALLMVATLPGRTHGLGLVTKPLLEDLDLGQVTYGAINFWATLLGATFCIFWGWLSDRLDTRLVLVGTLVTLGAVVHAMSDLGGSTGTVLVTLFVLVLLTRGLGQSALSVLSLALVGRAAGRRAGPAMGVYSFLVAAGFMAAFGLIKYALEGLDLGWREVWAGIGLGVIALAPFCLIFVRPRVSGWDLSAPEEGASGAVSADSFTLGQALRTPAFWVFGLATSLYGLTAAGISLFNEFILNERGFERGVFLTITVLAPVIGLAGNLVTGWLATRYPFGPLLGIALFLLAAALLAFPLVTTLAEVYLYAAVLGVAGGMVTVVFFGVWGQVFGPAHLGKIQGAAQTLTVLASAVGPWILPVLKEATGSYVVPFQILAAASFGLAVAACLVPLPRMAPVRRPAEVLAHELATEP
jgi:MFS family permease